MSGEPNSATSTAVPGLPPLRQQQRNLIVFASCVALQYLSAPVIYVGITQGSLLDKLGANPVIANIPGASFFVMATLVALISWGFPKVRHLKPILVTCYSVAGITAGLTALVLAMEQFSTNTKIMMVILQSGMTGATVPTAIAFIWEVLGRTTESSRRGVALGMAYGIGPLLAAVGSLGSQLILAGHFEMGPLALSTSVLPSPLNYALLFALVSPVMLAAAALVSQFTIPLPATEAGRKPATQIIDISAGILISILAMVASLFSNLLSQEGEALTTTPELVDGPVRAVYHFLGNLLGTHEVEPLAAWLMGGSSLLMILATLFFAWHFRDLLSVKILRLITLATLLFYVGNVIPTNMNLYSKSVLGVDPAEYAGYQNLMRFSFKALAGLGLGWLLVKTNPRSGILVTATLYLAALSWAMVATGKVYLVAFGIFGAGELIGVYAPNYMLSACRQDQMKRGQVLMNLLMGPVGQMGIVFGWVATTVDQRRWSLLGQTSQAFGFQVSFALCGLFLIAGILLVLFRFPTDPGTSRATSLDQHPVD